MRLFALELNNDIKGITKRKIYIESLIAQLDAPDFVILPELALCSYMANPDMWKYADDCGKDASEWSVMIAKKYHTYVGVGYLDKENDDYYNRYLIAGPEGVCGVVTKSEGESAVFKRGSFNNVIVTPFGNIGVAICYDSKRKHFYDNVKNKDLSLILFPHGCPADPTKPEEEKKTNDMFCGKYLDAFSVPVVYVNSIGKLESMPGKMGAMMLKSGFKMNGHSKIYAPSMCSIQTNLIEAIAGDVSLSPQRLKRKIHFYKEDLIPSNWLFRYFILRPDTKAGIKFYERNHTRCSFKK